jgi:TP901 family phage tail tape measure protein
MPVFLDVETKVNRRAVEATANEFRSIFNKLGADISHGFGAPLSKALGALDSGAARAELGKLETAWTRAADAEADAALRMESSARQVEAAQARAAEMSERFTASHSRAITAQNALADTQARAARDQRTYTDALAANEAAHQSHTQAMTESAAATSMAGRAFNAAGVGSLAVFTGSVLEATKSAGDFQASQTRLVASAGETAQGMKAVSDGVLQLAGQVGYSAQQLSNSMYTVEKAGYRGTEGVTVLKAAAQGAKSENAELGEVLNGLTNSMHDFGYGANDAADVMSKLVAANGMAKSTFQEFTGAMYSAEPIISKIGESQKLTADQMKHLGSDVLAVGAAMTQTGMSANVAFDYYGHAAQKMLSPTQQMREEMGALGIDAQDIQEHLGERGLAGTMQILQKAVQDHTVNGQVQLNGMEQNAQASRAEAEAFDALAPAARRVAQEIKDGTLSHAEFRKSHGGLSEELSGQISQWDALNTKLTGFSAAVKSGIGDQQGMDQALKLLLGDQETLQVALQTTGDGAKNLNDNITTLDGTTRESDGTVKGFKETTETLNFKIQAAKDAFGAVAIEVGTGFIPMMTSATDAAKWVGDELAKHPGIAHAVVDALGALGGAWALIKTANIAGAILGPITSGLVGMVAEEEAATAAAGRLTGALSAIGKGGALAIGAQLGGQALQDATDQGSFWNSAAVVGTDAATGAAIGGTFGSVVPVIGTGVGAAVGGVGGAVVGLYNQVAGHARGGAIHGHGSKGRDSVPLLAAPGEHMLTVEDVTAAGGHAGVYSWRNALHRAEGGAIGPDVEAAYSMMGTKYSQGDRTDCSGMVGRVVNGAMGIPGGGLPTTKNMGTWLAARGFQSGMGGPGTISVAWYDHGPNPNDGHAAMTLSDGENAEAGGSHGNFVVGSGAQGASSSQFDHRMFLPNMYGEGSETGGGLGGFGGGGGGFGGLGGSGGAGGLGGGGGGSYSVDPAKVQRADDHLATVTEKLATAREHEAEVDKDPKAKQSAKDKARDEVTASERELAEAKQEQAAAHRGTFRAGKGGAGGMGGLPVGLPGNFGLGKGLPGLAEWAIAFVSDLALAPIENGVMAALGGGGGALGAFTGGPLGGASFGGGGVASLASDVIPTPHAGGGGGGGGGGASPAGGPTGGAAGGAASAGGWLAAARSGRGALGPAGATPNAAAPGGQPLPTDLGEQLAKRGFIDAFQPPSQSMYNGPQGLSGLYGAAPGQGGMPVPNTWPQGVHPPTAADIQNLPGPWGPKRFATGGPSGTDTIPAWLSPGEEVEQKGAVDKYGAPFMDALNQQKIDPASVRYYDVGGGVPQPGQQPAQQPKIGQALGQPKPGAPGAPGAPQPQQKTGSDPNDIHGAAGGAPLPQGAVPGDAQTRQGVATPGASKETFGQDLPASPGIGIGGGIIGAAEGAASQAAGLAAGAGSFGAGGGAASSATQAAFQLINRTAAYGAQMGGIGVEALLETVLPSDSALSNFSNTLPGKVLAGVSGVRPSQPTSAGQTKAPLTSDQAGGQGAQSGAGGQGDGANHFHGDITVNANNFDDMAQSAAAKKMHTEYTAGKNSYGDN